MCIRDRRTDFFCPFFFAVTSARLPPHSEQKETAPFKISAPQYGQYFIFIHPSLRLSPKSGRITSLFSDVIIISDFYFFVIGISLPFLRHFIAAESGQHFAFSLTLYSYSSIMSVSYTHLIRTGANIVKAVLYGQI